MQSNQQQPQQLEQQPVQPVQQGETHIRHTQYGTYELRILGDPNKLLEIPIEYFYGKNALLPRR